MPQAGSVSLQRTQSLRTVSVIADDERKKPRASSLVLPSRLAETPLPPRREEDSIVDDADAISVVDAIKTTRKANLEKERIILDFIIVGVVIPVVWRLLKEV